MKMDKSAIRDFLNKSYKNLANKFVIANLDEDSITIWDFAMNVPYKWIAKKLIKEYGFEMVHIKVGGEHGNGWLFTKSSLGI